MTPHRNPTARTTTVSEMLEVNKKLADVLLRIRLASFLISFALPVAVQEN
jgi:hypothetical protein